ncbi:UBX domain-containing protein 4-like [Corticium candelabrum]|uniref:UBX domain-containing protein 4-like n=1 Tax=Corticium candelabrum TaxID=121492 RepID=UPI002E26267B|nr:UBX domain-containing protein 4-like [Corticium candelabrum]
MQWFSGPVSEAVQIARSDKKLFVVYIYGDNETSKNMSKVWEDAQVASEFADCISLRLASESESFQQFSQYYPVSVVPSTYFIGQNGYPLEIILGSVDNTSLVEKLKRVAEAHRVEVESQAVETSRETTTEILSTTETSATVVTSSVVATAAAAEAGDNLSDTEVSDVMVQSTEKSIDERVTSARDKISDLRKKKAEQQAEQDKQRELNRRQMGRDIVKAKQEREQLQAKQRVDQLRRDRENDRLAKEAVKLQLERDKEERASRFKVDKMKRDAEAEVKKAEKAAVKEKEMKQQHNQTRIQFRLPDGTSFTHLFQSSQTLQEMREVVSDYVSLKYSTFSLVATYPRRELVPDLDNSTLLDLQLAPSRVVMVTSTSKISHYSSVSNTLEGSTVWAVVMLPFTIVWSLIMMIVALFKPPSASPASGGAEKLTSGSRSDNQSHGNDNSDRQSSVRSRWNSQRDGNVHRMKTDDDDGENNTWNGNSTQQQ